MFEESTKHNTIQVAAAQNGLSLKAYRGDGMVLLAFDLDQHLTPNLAGFAIQCMPPHEPAVYLPNRLNFAHAITSDAIPRERTWTPSNVAPFQKFRWIDVPADLLPGTYTYQVTAMYFGPNGSAQLSAGAVVSISLDLLPAQPQFPQFQIGFTRGYLSSQAYADIFENKMFEPTPKTIDYDTAPYEKQYQWLGFHARKMIFDFLKECLDDPDVQLDLSAYDLDEPDIIRTLQQFGPRLRAVLDDASLHSGPHAPEPRVRALLQQSAGPGNIVVGHFKRFAHDKVLIKKKNGQSLKVLTGSTNFSVRGLYVQANNVLVFDDPGTTDLYEQAFEVAFHSMAKAAEEPIAAQWFDRTTVGSPKFSVSFAPHRSAGISLDKVSEALKHAQSSVLFAVMELDGGGDVLRQLRSLPERDGIFSYGITQAMKTNKSDLKPTGVKVYKPGQSNGVLTSFAYLKSQVPEPFRAEYAGGAGQVIHDKFIVIDFNDGNPLVFTGSSNLAEGGEKENGDNLLCIADQATATAYAVEAIRLIDHYHFRADMRMATDDQPLQLQSNEARWWAPYYDSQDLKFHERTLFSH